jgi:hypothetical protein
MVGHDADLGYTVVVMPWSQGAPHLSVAANRMLLGAHIEALTHGF